MSRTRVITVSATCAGVGKTRLIEKLIPVLENCAAVKARPHEGRDLSVVMETDRDMSPGKDTGRFLAAGAVRSYLIEGCSAEVRQAVQAIIDSGQFGVVVVESNEMARELDSDLSFFVRGEGRPKPGADGCLELADVVVELVVAERKEKDVTDEGKAKVVEELRRAARNGRITCAAAFEVAERLGVSKRLVGETANEERIKITACQLGCF